MDRVDCLKCENWRGGHRECKHGFRSASTAGGSAVTCKEDVYRCRDYDEKEEENDV